MGHTFHRAQGRQLEGYGQGRQLERYGQGRQLEGYGVEIPGLVGSGFYLRHMRVTQRRGAAADIYSTVAYSTRLADRKQF